MPRTRSKILICTAACPKTLNQRVQQLGRRFRAELHEYEDVGSFLESDDPCRTGCLVAKLRDNCDAVSAAALRLAAVQSPMKVILATRNITVPTVVQIMRCGVSDVIQYPFPEERLADALAAAIACSRQQAARIRLYREATRRLTGLTPREQEIMNLVTAGWTNRAIGDHLGISIRTVETHRGEVMKKMRVSSLAELVRLNLTLLAECDTQTTWNTPAHVGLTFPPTSHMYMPPSLARRLRSS